MLYVLFLSREVSAGVSGTAVVSATVVSITVVSAAVVSAAVVSGADVVVSGETVVVSAGVVTSVLPPPLPPVKTVLVYFCFFVVRSV